MAVINRQFEERIEGFAGLSLSSILSDYIGNSRLRARNVAMLSLVEICGWSLPEIMLFSGLSKPAVSLAISKTQRELAAHLAGEEIPAAGDMPRPRNPAAKKKPRSQRARQLHLFAG